METQKLESYVQSHIKASTALSSLSAKEFLGFSVTGLNEEAGEVAGLLCRESYKCRPMSDDRWIEELGDCLWYLVAILVSKGFSLEQLFEYNKNKLQERYGREINEK